MLQIAIPKEIYPGERRVAVTPSTVAKLLKLGQAAGAAPQGAAPGSGPDEGPPPAIQILVEAGAGAASDYPDGAYAEVGATIVPDAETLWRQADLVLKVRPPTQHPELGRHEADLLKEGGRLISFLWPGQNGELVERLAERRATVLAMDSMPRITRAQRMDALSAMANIIGYRAVLEAAHLFGRVFPGQHTAAGRIAPAKVLVIGAGVAGLSAVACARSLGAVVRAFDTRPAVREQVESLGATFLELQFEESGEGEGGYAKEMSEAFLAAEQALIARHAEEVDIIISTAVIPGKRAPVLITSGAVISMQPGSVIVDLAAEQGGNCALTERDRLVEKFGVKIAGYTDLASRMARQASDLYAVTVYNLFEEVFNKDKGDIALDLEDEIHRGVVVLDKGKLLWPPPSRPQPRAAAPLPERKPSQATPAPQPQSGRGGLVALALGVSVLLLAGLVARGPFLQHLTVFLLACVVGWHVVWNVTPALHTPLMSVTNAVSGIILIGGVLLMGGGRGEGGPGLPLVLAAIAVLIAMINVAGGFLVTQRMLRMFRR